MTKAVVNVFFLTLIFWAVIAYDITSHGSLESSRIGRVLKDAGLLIYVKPYYTIVEDRTVSVYSWGKKNFPYNEYNLLKNKTFEISRDVGHQVVQVSKTTISAVKKYSVISYNYVAAKFPSNFSEKVLKSLSDSYEFLVKYSKIVFDYLVERTIYVKKWLLENVSKDSFTWENVEKMYFQIARKLGIYYSNITTWVGRKVNCLILA